MCTHLLVHCVTETRKEQVTELWDCVPLAHCDSMRHISPQGPYKVPEAVPLWSISNMVGSHICGLGGALDNHRIFSFWDILCKERVLDMIKES